MTFDGHYLDWNQKRVKGIVDFYGYKFMYGKKILDLGCGYADISGVLHRLGSDVTAVDSRNEHLKIVNKKFSGIKTIQADLDRGWPLPANQSFDVILDLGILCHLANFEEHLRTVCAHTNYLVLETAVADSDDPGFCVAINESKGTYDKSANGLGCRPSATAIERVLRDCGMSFQRVDNAKYNTNQYVYDWSVTNSTNIDLHKRRIWFANKTAPAVVSQSSALTLMSQPHTIQTLNSSQSPILAPLPLNITPPPITPGFPTNPPPPPSPNRSNSLTGPQPVSNIGPPRVRLFYNYYVDPNDRRRNEIDLCLSKNMDNNLFDLVILDSPTKPTFNFFFQKINQLAGPNDVSIFCTADIFFDRSITISSKITNKEVYALSRWDWKPSNNSSILANPDIQNAWIIRGKIEGVDGNFPVGAPGSSGRIAYEFQKAGYRIINPCRVIKAYHIHDSGVKNYNETDRVEGPYIVIEPTST